MRTALLIASLAISGAFGLVAASPASAQSMAPTQASYGYLRPSDPTDAAGRHMQALSLQFFPGQAVDIGLSSQAFDPVLSVLGPDGTTVATNDDAPGEGLNSRVRFQVMTPGVYRVVVTSYQPGSTGAYRLECSRTAAVARPVAPSAYGYGRADEGDDDDDNDSAQQGGGYDDDDDSYEARRARWERRRAWRMRHGYGR